MAGSLGSSGWQIKFVMRWAVNTIKITLNLAFKCWHLLFLLRIRSAHSCWQQQQLKQQQQYNTQSVKWHEKRQKILTTYKYHTRLHYNIKYVRVCVCVWMYVWICWLLTSCRQSKSQWKQKAFTAAALFFRL